MIVTKDIHERIIKRKYNNNDKHLVFSKDRLCKNIQKNSYMNNNILSINNNNKKNYNSSKYNKYNNIYKLMIIYIYYFLTFNIYIYIIKKVMSFTILLFFY